MFTRNVNSNTSIVDMIPLSAAPPATPISSTTILVPQTTTMAVTVRAKAEEKRQFKDMIANQTIELAKTNINAALKHIENHFPWDYLRNAQWLFYIHII